MSRDPKTHGGEDTLYTRQRKVFAPYGTQMIMRGAAPDKAIKANIRNPRSESGISYIGSNTHSLAERGASAIRVWTPAVHELVVLHDKGARRILSP